MCCSRPPRWTRCQARRATARWRGVRSTRCLPAHASTSPPTSATRWTSCCGSRRSRTSRAGRARPALRRQGVRAGISNARQCRWRSCSSRSAAASNATIRPATCSTFTAAGSISSFPTTRTRSRSPAAPSARSRMANVWVHNGFLQVEGEKMSKSLGNFVTIRELLRHDDVRRPHMVGRGAAACDAAHPLPPADRLDGQGARRGRGLRWIAGIDAIGGTSKPGHEALRRPESHGAIVRATTSIRAGRAFGELSSLQLRSRQLARKVACARSGWRGQTRLRHVILKSSANLLGLLQQTRSRRQAAGLDGRADRATAEIDAIVVARVRPHARRRTGRSPIGCATSSPRLGVAIKDNKDGTTTWELKR